MKLTAVVPSVSIAALALVLSAGAAAQSQVYKCVNASGKLTYSSTQCSDLGLKDGGELRNQISVTPAQKFTPPAPAPTPKPPAAAAQAGGAPADGKNAKDAKKEPERRCFKTAQGTRCNDKPDDD